MEKKRIKCWEWKVQIADCRYRPLDQTFDNYKPQQDIQTPKDYYIHHNWTDQEVRQFRSNVRRQNICVRQGLKFYSSKLERKRINKKLAREIKNMKEEKVVKLLPDAWFPEKITSSDLKFKNLSCYLPSSI